MEMQFLFVCERLNQTLLTIFRQVFTFKFVYSRRRIFIQCSGTFKPFCVTIENCIGVLFAVKADKSGFCVKEIATTHKQYAHVISLKALVSNNVV